MAQTVIGIFKNSTEAENARQHLVNNGFDYERVDVASQSPGGYGDESGSDKDQDFGDRIGNFFRNLFSDEDEVSRYSTAAARGTVVTVHAQTADEAETAADILDDYGAVDVDEYAATDRTGMTGSTDTAYGDTEVNRTSSSDSVFDSGRVSPAGANTNSDFSDTDSGRYSNAGSYAQTNSDSINSGIDINRMTGADRTENSGIYTGRDRDLANQDTNSDKDSQIYSKSDSDISNRSLDNDRIGDRTDTTIPIIEESLNVGKKEVQTGGTRLHSRIVERPVEETIRLREERVRIERNPADRIASEEEMSNFREGTVEITESKEVPVVDKEARVVEEVNVYKDVDERQEVIRETLRNTEVETDDITASDEENDLDEDESDRHKHNEDDIHRQRPGII